MQNSKTKILYTLVTMCCGLVYGSSEGVEASRQGTTVIEICAVLKSLDCADLLRLRQASKKLFNLITDPILRNASRAADSMRVYISLTNANAAANAARDNAIAAANAARDNAIAAANAAANASANAGWITAARANAVHIAPLAFAGFTAGSFYPPFLSNISRGNLDLYPIIPFFITNIYACNLLFNAFSNNGTNPFLIDPFSFFSIYSLFVGFLVSEATISASRAAGAVSHAYADVIASMANGTLSAAGVSIAGIFAFAGFMDAILANYNGAVAVIAAARAHTAADDATTHAANTHQNANYTACVLDNINAALACYRIARAEDALVARTIRNRNATCGWNNNTRAAADHAAAAVVTARVDADRAEDARVCAASASSIARLLSTIPTSTVISTADAIVSASDTARTVIASAIDSVNAAGAVIASSADAAAVHTHTAARAGARFFLLLLARAAAHVAAQDDNELAEMLQQINDLQ